jgi:hypothetical protein
MNLNKIFRVDDICINTDKNKILKIVATIMEKYPSAEIVFGVSPLVHDMSSSEGKRKERIFPEILNAYSDFRLFYKVDLAGVPVKLIEEAQKLCPRLKLAGHGIVHLDHRLLTKEVKELSILVSCSLIKASAFIPPFNKYDVDIEEICKEHSIDLIKFEDGWKHLLYNKISENSSKYYFHTHDFTLEELVSRI